MGLCSNLRKFGLGHSDLPTILWNMTVMLRVVVLDVDRRNKNGIPFIFYILFPFMVGSYIYVFVFSGIWFVLVRSGELGLETYRFVVLSMIICTEIGPLKYIYLLYNKSMTCDLIDHYLSCDAQVEPNSRMSRNLLKNMRIIKKRAIVSWAMLIGCGACYVSRPIFSFPKRTVNDDKFRLYGLEPVLESPNYELYTTTMSLGTFFTVFLAAQINALLVSIAGYVESQLLALSIELQSIWKDADEHYEETLNNSGPTNADDRTAKNVFITEKLRVIQNFHRMNIELMIETQGVFKNAFVGELLVLIAGLIMELLAGLENAYVQLLFTFFQVGIVCVAGQKVIDAGTVFENALYDSKWENFDVTNRKTILSMLLNSQKTLHLTAGGVSIMNFELLMGITKSVYSAYTALQTKD